MNLERQTTESAVPAPDAPRSWMAIAVDWWRSHRSLVEVAMLVAVSCAVYANTLENRFAYDDDIQVVQNPYIRRLANLPGLFVMPTWPGSVYRPIVLATYSLTHAVVGLEPWLYHATNVLLHAAVVALAYLVLIRLVERRIAFVACLLFAVHPIHVDAIAGVANRTELMGALFGLFCIRLVLGWDEARSTEAPAGAGRGAAIARLGTIWLAALLALLSKESALTLFLLVPLCLWLRRPGVPVPGWAELRQRYLPPLVAMAAALAVCVAVRQMVLGDLVRDPSTTPALDNPLGHVSTGERMLRAAVLLGRYLSAIIAPLRLSPDYSLGTPDLGAPLGSAQSLAQLALVAGLVGLIALGWRRDRRLAFFALWFLAAFALTANLLFPMPTVFGERLAYLPSLGVAGLAAWCLVRLPARSRVVAVSAIACLLALRTWTYNPAWRDNDALFQYAMDVVPGSARVQIGYGQALVRNGALSAARGQFQETIARHPFYADPHYGLALVDLHEGRREEAIESLEHALALSPTHLPSLILLGRVKLRGGEVDDAARLFVRALNQDNFHFDARLGILTATLERGNLTQAVALRAELLAIDPGSVELLEVSRELDERLAASPAGGSRAERAEVAPAG